MFFGRYESAISDYNKAISLNPDFATAYGNRGDAKRALGQYNTAIADCNAAIRLIPDYPNAYATRGEAKVGLNRIEEAKSDFQRSLELAEKRGEEGFKTKIMQRLQKLNDTE